MFLRFLTSTPIPINASELTIDYENGTIQVESDDGNQDYFVTYEMNLFPSDQLWALVRLSLMEINASAQLGTYLTSYENIDDAPVFWDAPLVYGAAAKAFRRLQTDGTLWKNFLIWQEGAPGQQIASEASSFYQTQYDELRQSVKMGKFLARPGLLYNSFTVKGFSGGGLYGGRFRSILLQRSIYIPLRKHHQNSTSSTSP